MTSSLALEKPAAAAPLASRRRAGGSLWPFVLPALIVVASVIVFPWAFTIWMSLNEWQIGGGSSFVGLA
ncbi:MAG TPA: hypothetical protein VNS22_17620, partial [Geminicoccus sp.]